MKLPQAARAALAAVEYAPDVPFTTLAKSHGIRASTLKYYVHKLLQTGVMRYYPVVNVYRLGYTAYSLYLAVTPHETDRLQQLIAAVCQESCVSWVAEVGGEYQLCVSVLVQTTAELSAFLDRLAARFGSIINDKAVVTQVSLSMFPTKYLSPRPPVTVGLTWGRCDATADIDALDRRVLHGLMEQRVPSQRELARTLGVAVTTLQERLARLRSSGVIIGSVYLVSADSLQMQTFKVLVSTREPHSLIGSDLFRFCQRHPQVTSFIHALGSWDYEIGVEVETPSATTAFIAELSASFAKAMTKVRTVPMFRELKVACFPFTER